MAGPLNNSLFLLPEQVQNSGGVADLPVTAVLEELDTALNTCGRALLEAPPGAGKTTLVPLALMNRPWLDNKKIIMLEPRRLAARACAAHMAFLLGESLGQTIGYQVRMDRCVSRHTRIEVVTEGILTRRLQSDPGLEGVGLLIFDEFHERHLHADLALALSLDAAEAFCPDLGFLVMSATLDTDPLSRLMGSAPVIASKGKSWPVETVYVDPNVQRGSGARAGGYRPKWAQLLPVCRNTVIKALAGHDGDVLVFLPGAAAIRALAEKLNETFKADPKIRIFQLFGNLPFKEQKAAIAPALAGTRKIVLATPIAETSLTIQGIRIVVDSGLMNQPEFSPGRGMTRLETRPVSQASADQRRGRAGRTAPGICFRLWPEHVHQGLIPFNRPEILKTDLTHLILELSLWGVTDPADLKWLDIPSGPAVDSARTLLVSLNALDREYRITPHGRQMLTAGIHPRLAHMMIRAKEMGHGFLGCCLCALAEERDIIPSGRGRMDPDIVLRLEVLEKLARTEKGKKFVGYPDRARSVLVRARHLSAVLQISDKPERMIHKEKPTWDLSAAGRLLAQAFPDRVAARRSERGLAYLTASGSGVSFDAENTLSSAPFIVAFEVDGNPGNARIFLAAALDQADLEHDFSHDMVFRDVVAWDKGACRVKAVSQACLGSIVVREHPLSDPDPDKVRAALIQGVRETGLQVFVWPKKTMAFRHRVCFLKNLAKEAATSSWALDFSRLPDVSDPGLVTTLERWLGPFIFGAEPGNGLKGLDLDAAVKSLFTWDQLKLVDQQAPTHIRVPSGSNIPIQYTDKNGPVASPVLAVRIQEIFGMPATPFIAGGRMPVTLHLLSPASRPVQITTDLAHFWAQTYQDVKKDLMGRYPKHFWPEDPLSAPATARAKPKKQKR